VQENPPCVHGGLNDGGKPSLSPPQIAGDEPTAPQVLHPTAQRKCKQDCRPRKICPLRIGHPEAIRGSDSRFRIGHAARQSCLLSAIRCSPPCRPRHPMTGLQGWKAPAAGNFPIFRPHPIHRKTVTPVLTPLPPRPENPAKTPQVLASVTIVGRFHGKPKRLGSRSERSGRGKRHNKQKRSGPCRLLPRAGSSSLRRLPTNLAGMYHVSEAKKLT